MQGFYAALSYVWGEPQPHSVCTTKLSTYLESIDILLLPKTIRDAIFCTYSLNLRYLWVDTLCILQDLNEDKQREIPQMCDIYRCAYVTIIAASSHKVSEGFLHNRKKPVETLLPFWCPDGRLGTISVDESDGSARTLSSNDVEALLTAWRNVLYDYTRRAVSDPSDRLVAISGIAQLFQRSWGSSNRYIAGLWERNLSSDLLWYRNRPSDGSLVPGQFLAPSWSWAATIGCIAAGWDKKVGNIIWDVHSCDAIPVSDNHPLGQVRGGKLIVRAIMRDVTWDPAEPELFELKRPCSNNHAKRRQSNEVTAPSKGRERHIGYGYFDYDSAGIGADKGKAVVVSSDKDENPGYLTGLIVVPAESAGEFRRVGIFHVDGRFYEDEEAPYCDVKSWLDTPSTEAITII
ncbi:heterokaryon incompatibility protein-domain-containing protein [Suillus subaureus]|uniref:Heterokaryon incompatibility protein-domain-containing protein n=1 Tax=Suillus subaureus TaxID=48587 RepID=A0A9P7DW46_9AGAM|nr:heterokaryon incompatibility protein-domain-containing protein [Suillus subaureus]KAG1804418.1 heterokaryon incompatibility protein-domain-containing protein [Suillus subaureus]